MQFYIFAAKKKIGNEYYKLEKNYYHIFPTEIKLASFDRFFPNQDYMPKGGLGNLIALPLQKKAREKNHSVYIDPATSNAYEDQWAFLSAIKKNANVFVEQKVSSAQIGRAHV